MILNEPQRLPDSARPFSDDVFYRALTQDAERIDRGVYLVGGHWVNLVDIDTPSCDCGYYTYGDKVCKHMVAGLIREADMRCLQGLTRLILETAGRHGTSEGDAPEQAAE